MKKLGVVHAIFTCADCGLSWEDWLTAKKSATTHETKTGHRVSGEEGVAYASEKDLDK